MGQFESGTGVPPVNHAQDARATIKLTHYVFLELLDQIEELDMIRRAPQL